MKIKIQMVRDEDGYKLALATRTVNDTEIDHIKLVELDKDVVSSVFLMGNMFEVDFDGIKEAFASEEAIEKVKKQKKEAADKKQETVEVVEAEVVEG